jgi:hypothetical protein
MEIIGPVLSLGISPVFLNRNPQQTNVGELVHKRFWIQRSRLPQVSFNPLATVSQGSNGLFWMCDLGSNQASAVLVMGAVLGDGKAMTCCVAG